MFGNTFVLEDNYVFIETNINHLCLIYRFKSQEFKIDLKNFSIYDINEFTTLIIYITYGLTSKKLGLSAIYLMITNISGNHKLLLNLYTLTKIALENIFETSYSLKMEKTELERIIKILECKFPEIVMEYKLKK